MHILLISAFQWSESSALAEWCVIWNFFLQRTRQTGFCLHGSEVLSSGTLFAFLSVISIESDRSRSSWVKLSGPSWCCTQADSRRTVFCSGLNTWHTRLSVQALSAHTSLISAVFLKGYSHITIKGTFRIWFCIRYGRDFIYCLKCPQAFSPYWLDHRWVRSFAVQEIDYCWNFLWEIYELRTWKEYSLRLVSFIL